MSFISGGTTIRADINQALIEAPAEIGLIGADILLSCQYRQRVVSTSKCRRLMLTS